MEKRVEKVYMKVMISSSFFCFIWLFNGLVIIMASVEVKVRDVIIYFKVRLDSLNFGIRNWIVLEIIEVLKLKRKLFREIIRVRWVICLLFVLFCIIIGV